MGIEPEGADRQIENIPTLAEFVRESWHVLEGTNRLDWNWHIEAMAIHAQELLLDWLRHRNDPSYKQRFQKFLINITPGSMKSRTISVCLPSWFWLHCPSWRAMFLTANPRVAVRDSLFCRDLIASDWYQETFRPSWRLRYDQNTKTLFSNTEGGYRQALGWNSRIIGARADALIVDDPQDAEEAHSPAKRQTVIDRWDNAIGNRVNDLRTSVSLGIMQRLREDDWSAHVLTQGWSTLVIRQEFEGPEPPTPIGWVDPRTEVGELMAPDRFPRSILAAEKLRLGMGYAGQHQQRPTAAGGGMFRIRNWRLYNPRKMPSFRRSVLSLDCSFKGGKTSDYNAMGMISETTDYREILLPRTYIDRDTGVEHHHVERAHSYYIRDLWREKADIIGVETALQQFTRDYPEALIKLIEDKANGPAIITRLSGVIPGITPINPGRASKEERAASIQPIQARGDIYLPIDDQYCAVLEAMGLDSISIDQWWGINPPAHESDAEYCPVAPWAKDLINEFANFPNAANDDIVDMTDQAIIWMQANIGAGNPGTAAADKRSLAERTAARRSHRPVKARAF